MVPPSGQSSGFSRIGYTTIGMAGLRNLGNTCFFNSTIQCLSATTPFARFFRDGSFRRHLNRSNSLGTGGAVTTAFADLIRAMWSEQETVVVPSKFKDVIGKYHPEFQGSDQQDSSEFLQFIMDAMHEDMNVARRPGVTPEKEPDDEEHLSDQVAASRAWQRYTRLNWSIIVDLFQGQLQSRLTCLTCRKTSTTYNAFMYLTLPIPEMNRLQQRGGPVYLEECLDKFLEVETLSGADAWHCPRCKQLRTATKQLAIMRLPPVLLINLKRFYYQGHFRNKIDTYVEYETGSLSLTHVVAAPRDVPPPQREAYVYDLYAISNHYGGLSGGHYTANIKNGHKQQWYNFNDARITECKESDVKTKAAYTLYYVRATAPGQQLVSGHWWDTDLPSASGSTSSLSSRR
ncbi:hypothetical protein CXG81DRAFT_11753 [Caulochytrium protostelioides]|uniref:Ubiquitin carboxyl-terminal hydrolase n=1 Tax=Caulochytrium protostelioides TaxID=1555241 RepID=A0A4P9X959_9FUNG|nr:hypothetical protein CXG81DRAFT_11753 [Caulochytrium protostelioides]|eukprot:RKP01610.1 hypothetical protein CXG81DRAFT_11753 [Caulochytrium protostelioides]